MTGAAEEGVVRYRVDDGVAVVTLNRPDRLNAWNPELGVAYFRALDRAVADEAVGAIVVTGAGRGFCAGADAQVLDNLEDGDSTVDGRPMSYPRTLPKLTVAAVNGACAGLGLVHAMLLDVRFAAADAKLTAAFTRLGLVAECGIAWLAQRLVGLPNAADILLSSRVFTGMEAAGLGLCKAALPREDVLPAAIAYARDVARNCSPAAVAAVKWQLSRAAEQTFAEAEATAAPLVDHSLTLPDFAEALESRAARRAPAFRPWGADPGFTPLLAPTEGHRP